MRTRNKNDYDISSRNRAILNKNGGKLTTLRKLKRDWRMLILLIPTFVLLFIFCYLPMYGLVIAFQNYKLGASLLSFDGSIQWVGIAHFKRFLSSIFFGRIFTNTLRLSVLSILFGFSIPVVFALLLNEIQNKHFKKTVQTFVYMPYFISTVIVVAMILTFVSSDGIVNQLRFLLGHSKIAFINDPKYFDMIYIVSGIWQTYGYSAVIYIAVIASIDPNLYDAATVDGANRLGRMLHITLPGITPTIVILLILSVGGVLNSNTEKIILLYNPSIYEKADVIGSYVYRLGIIEVQYSYTTAVGLFSSVVNFILLFFANTLSKRISDYSLW